MFDLVCGSSTGAILAFLLGVRKTSLDECSEMYRHLAQEIFSVNTLIGTGKLFFNHAYYDTLKFESILRYELDVPNYFFLRSQLNKAPYFLLNE